MTWEAAHAWALEIVRRRAREGGVIRPWIYGYRHPDTNGWVYGIAVTSWHKRFLRQLEPTWRADA